MGKRVHNNKSIETELFLKKLEEISAGLKRFDKKAESFKQNLILNRSNELLLENYEAETSILPLKK